MVGHSLNSPSVCDIEDIGNEGDLNATQRLMRSDVVVRAKKSINDTLTNISEAQSFIPGTQKVFIKTWGCTHNNSDGEYMAGLLAANGYEIVDDRDSAHVWLLNSCTVKNPAEDHFRNAVEMGTKRGKFVVVAGCVSQGSPQAEYLEKISIIGVQQIDRVVEVVEETLKGNKVRLLGKKKIGKKKTGGAALDLPKIRRNPLIEIIPINTGCLNQCTYCKTKHARGDLGSYSIEDIVQRAQQVFIEGVKEIWLTSEDTGAYGRDIGVSLPELLNEILPVIPDGCRLRLGMTNPPYILEHLEAMAGILSHPKVYSFLHIPVQSGSDMVLADMKREYCIKDFEKIVDFMRERVPGITIATDMICGFPTETEQDFKLSMALVEKYRFPSLFINQFYPRPGTPAAKMRRVPTQEVKRRTRLMTDLFESYSPYEERIGRVYEVLVTEESHDKLYYVAHNKYYEQILVPKDKKYLGQTINVKITSFGKHFMCGTPLGSHALLAHIKAPLSALRQIDIKSLWITGCVALIIISVVIKLRSKN